MTKYKQGKFRCVHPSKYKGNPSEIVWRSGWERIFMSKLDLNPNVIQWASEETIVRYRSPIDGKVHRYFPDFTITVKNKEGKIEKLMVEIKPKSQTVPPKVQSMTKPTRKYLNEVKNWGVNSAKWEAAEIYCKQNDMKFLIFTENELGVAF